MLPRGGATVIERLRVRGARDPLAVRRRAESLLAAVDLRPRWLPRDAVLVLRSMRARSRALFEGRVDVTTLRAWERELGDAVDRMARHAARPLRDAVPADAEAVLFDDHADLLACMARDARTQTLAERWWWQRMLGAVATPRAVARAWREAPEHVPAALARLHGEDEAARFVEVLTTGERRAVLLATLEAHGLPALLTVFEAGSDAPPATPFAGARPATYEPPWRDVVAVRVTSDGAGDALLGVGLMIARAPWRARSARFAEEVRRWMGAPRPEHVGGAIPARTAGERKASAPPFEPRDDGALTADERAKGHDPPARGRPAEAANVALSRDDSPRDDSIDVRRGYARAAHSQGTASTETAPSAGAHAGVKRRFEPARSHAEAVVRHREMERPDQESSAPQRQLVASQPEAIEAIEARDGTDAVVIRTALGGVFFLVNVGISLGLYGDFTTPREPGLALPIWDWLALVGGALLDDGHREDPLWGLLAELAGRRAGENPGEGFEAPTSWELPPEWRADDLPASAPGEARDVDSWIGWLASHVRARLSLALSVEGGRVAEVLLERRARVRVTATSVEVTLSLQDLPIEVRRSGIDRDVGWVPAAGRYVRFQFEG